MSRKKKTQAGKKTDARNENKNKRSTSSSSQSCNESKESTNDTTSADSSKDSSNGSGSSDSAKGSRSKINDPAFYMKDAALATTAGSLNTSQPFGSEIRLQSKFNYHSAESISNNQAGIMVLNLKPTIGNCSDRNSPANVAATQLYINVRYVNSGRKNYDQQDLFIAELAIADIYSFIMWCQRIYACAYSYSQANWYIGRNLLEAQGINAQSVIDNLAQFRYSINAFINKVASFACPGDLSLFQRRAFTYSGVFIENDAEYIKDQIYMFNPDGFYIYKLDNKNKGALYYNRVDYSDPLTVGDLQLWMDRLLENVYGDEDFGLISGDIIKAYGSNLIALSAMPEAMYCVPTHDKDALRQIHNAKVVDVYRGDVNGSYSFEEEPLQHPFYRLNLGTESNPDYQYCIPGNVYQDAHGNLVCHELPGGQAYANLQLSNWKDRDVAMMAHGALIDFDDWAPSPEQVLETTRLVPVINPEASLDTYVFYDPAGDNPSWQHFADLGPIQCGADIVTRVAVYIKATRASNLDFDSDYITTIGDMIRCTYDSISLHEDNFQKTGLSLAILSQFQYSPMFVMQTWDTRTGIDSEVVTTSRMNSVSVPSLTMRNMHECCQLSLMYAPGIAKVDNLK